MNLSFFKKHLELITITTAYLIVLLLMLPLREVGFFDDFAYIRNVEHFVETGKFTITDWTSASLVFQILWGGLFAKIFGFSIKILQLSNYVLFYFGLLAFYGILRELKIDKLKSTIFTLFFLSIPWIIQYVFTFMSDIFYISLMVITIFFLIKGLNRNSILNLFLGGIFLGLSFLERQVAISTLVALVLVFIYQAIAKKEVYWKNYASALFPAGLIISGFYYWMSLVGMPYAMYVYHTKPLTEEFLKYVLLHNMKYIGTANDFHQELLIQRPSGYLYILAGHLFPVFLMFSVKITQISNIIKKNIRLIIMVLLVFGIYYLLNRIVGLKFVQYPIEVLRYDTLFLDWLLWWNKIVWISLPFWLITLTIAGREAFDTLFIRKTNKSAKYSKVLIIIFLIAGAVFIFNTAQTFFPYDVRFRPDPEDLGLTWKSLYRSLGNFFTPKIIDGTIEGSWMVFLLLAIFCALVYSFLFKIKPRFSPRTNIFIIFVALVLFFHFLVTILLAYGMWHEYIIPFIPLAIILLAYFFKNTKINLKVSIILLFLLLFLSIEVTRNRIQEQGTRWELATRLVQEGINPYNVSEPNWAWRPYWFWEECFTKAIATAGGDKFKVGKEHFGCWFKDSPPGDIYNINELATSNLNANLAKQPLAISESFWVFSKDRLILNKRLGVFKIER